MKIHKALSVSIALSICLGLLGCNKPENNEGHIQLKTEAHPSHLTGSLVQPSLNSPQTFGNAVINERATFKVEVKAVGNEVDELISNDDGTFTSIVMWEKSDQKFSAKGIIISIENPMTPDNAQVLTRLALRLNDSQAVEDAIRKNVKFVSLNNGAGMTIKTVEDRTQYEIY